MVTIFTNCKFTSKIIQLKMQICPIGYQGAHFSQFAHFFNHMITIEAANSVYSLPQNIIICYSNPLHNG